MNFNKNRLFALCFACLSLNSAFSQKGTVNKSVNSDSKEIKPVFREFLSFDNGRAHKLFLTDTTLIVWNPQGASDHFFYRYSLKTKKLIGKFIKGGRRFGQALGGNCAGLLGENTLWYYDVTGEKLILCDFAKPFSGSDTPVIKQYHISKPYYSLVLKNRENAIVSGSSEIADINDNSKLQLLNLATGKQTDQYGRYPAPPLGIPLGTWINAYQGFLFMKPDNQLAVLASRYTDQLEIFDLSAKKTKIVKGPEGFPPAFTPLKQSGIDLMARTAKTRFGFINGAVTNQYIYLMYSGDSEPEYRSHGFNGRNIYVYDWHGKLVSKILLDRYIDGFAIDAHNKLLYAFDPNTKTILRTSLK